MIKQITILELENGLMTIKKLKLK